MAVRHDVCQSERCESEPNGDGAASGIDIGRASEMLIAAVGAIQQAGRSARVCLRYSAGPRPHYTLEVLPRAGTPAALEFFVRQRTRAPR